MKKNILIIGSGGHAKVAIDAAERQGIYNIVGLIDSFRKVGEKTSGYSILGDISDIKNIARAFNVDGLFVAVGMNFARKSVIEKIELQHTSLPFITIIHPNSTIAKNSVIEAGTLICAGAIIAPDVKIGHHVVINHNACIDHDTIVEDFASFAPAAVCGGNCIIKNSSAICIGAIVREKITIGANSVLGAGSLVLHSQPENSVIYGSPARVIKYREVTTPYL